MRNGFRLLCYAAPSATLVYAVLSVLEFVFFGHEWLFENGVIKSFLSETNTETLFDYFWGNAAQIYIAILIVNAAWFYLASAKSVALSGRVFASTPSWSTLYFILPFVNFFAPFLVTRRLWNLSTRKGKSIDMPAPSFFWVWWLCWLTSLALSMQVRTLASERDWNTVYSDAIGLSAIGGFFSVIAALYFFHIQRSVSEGLR